MKYGNITLGQIEAGINKVGGEAAFMRLLNGELKVVEKIVERPPTIIEISAIESFTASEHFAIDTFSDPDAEIDISHLSETFIANFLKKVESHEVAAEELTISSLVEDALSPTIIAALGGEAQVEITLGQFFEVFAKQPGCESGPLLTDGRVNIGYVRNVNGVLWAVEGRKHWPKCGWSFDANPLDSPSCGYIGGHVLSHR